MKEVSVKVKADHLERLAKVKSPINAIAELIWNALDADATEVKVCFNFNVMEGLEGIKVIDNGHGLNPEDAIPAFENLGGSWKKDKKSSKYKHRPLHGKAGQGRFRAFALGKSIEWSTYFNLEGKILNYKINGSLDTLGTFTIADVQATEHNKTGTEVCIFNIEKNFPSLLGTKAIQEITELFALYLRQYPDVKIIYNNHKIDPSDIEERVSEYQLEEILLDNTKTIKPSLTVIEWKAVTTKNLYLCDSSGFALHETRSGIQASGFNFTVYLKDDWFIQVSEEGGFVELNSDLKKVLDLTKEKLKDHFRNRATEAAVNVVKDWKQQQIYPYEGNPKDVIEQTKRQVFDVCALNLSEYLPSFESSERKSKQLALRLLKQVLEESPKAVQRILKDVLDLPKEKQEEFAELLERTSLEAMINASKMVADRLDFLKGLEILVFDAVSREQLLERSQLHKILAEQTWVFGEEFNLTVNDQSLTEVLHKHLQLLGTDRTNLEPVLREDSKEGIVDLMLSRTIPQPRADQREHLVIELKRPNQKIDTKATTQIMEYAFAVAKDERFRDTNTRWIFWAISNEIADSVQRQAEQRHRPKGLYHEDPDEEISVWIKSWGQVIESCRVRLEFFQRQLQYTATKDSAITYLRKMHEKYLPQFLLDSSTED